MGKGEEGKKGLRERNRSGKNFKFRKKILREDGRESEGEGWKGKYGLNGVLWNRKVEYGG